MSPRRPPDIRTSACGSKRGARVSLQNDSQAIEIGSALTQVPEARPHRGRGRTVPEMGWGSKRNGSLLALAEGQFDAFLSVDRNLSFQNDVHRFALAGKWVALGASELLRVATRDSSASSAVNATLPSPLVSP